METTLTVPGDSSYKIVKWKVRDGATYHDGAILCLYQEINTSIVHKFKAVEYGSVVEKLVKEGETFCAGTPILKTRGCTHPIVMKDMCAECGANLRQDYGVAGDRKSSTSATVAMVHSVPELIVSEEKALELGKADEKRLLQSRKLVLLVDLDETVLHTTNDNVPANLKDVYHFQLWHGHSILWYHTKFRPYTIKFLDAISKLYELHICTFGARMYAHTMARYLDPEGKYFSHRILSRDECFDARSKTANLKALFPCGDSMVCIIDDRDEVWNFAPNMIRVKPYIFFDGTADINAPPGLGKGSGDPSDSKILRPKRKVRVTRVAKKKVESTSDDNNPDEKEVKTEGENERSDQSRSEAIESEGKKKKVPTATLR